MVKGFKNLIMQNESNSYTMYGFPYHSDYCDPVPLLGQAHTGMACTVEISCAVIIKQIQRNKRKSGGTCTSMKIMLVLFKHPLSLKSSSSQECLTTSSETQGQ